ncbi:cysteine desulfurase family protein [Corynebacterium frankenforstense]|uniref:cysteine desulfurase family protein n=1 Tax=Corynebacterium frankenforstense TaxID=1230998 RepID=UPI00254FDC7F|nr:cysteine desulfurase family protein [Corynebacterium frankenforstense]MDK6259781.1 cysteine desulfurase family protein [Corynebacterium frankenforstense]
MTAAGAGEHYLDHAATTPMRQCAIDAWVRHARDLNPGGQYAAGRAARHALDEAREAVAAALGADPVEVVFTGAGSEADNIAVQGLYRAGVAAGRPARVVASQLEHSAIFQTVRHLGAEVVDLPVDEGGRVSDLSALAEPAAVAACMLANNETGAIQPVDEVIAAADAAGTPVHIDAVQAVGKVAVDFHAMGATTLAASGHKFGGPRGVGVLLARRSPAPEAVVFGGGQERGLRPGTNDVAGAAAFTAALTEALAEREAENARVSALRDRLREGILAEIDDVRVNTTEPALPGHLSVSFPGAEGDSLIMLLDAAGIAAATGSACSSGVNRASRVLLAAGVPEATARGTLRFSLGHTSADADVDRVLAVLPEVVTRARAAGMA